jgi:hypothetical protein
VLEYELDGVGACYSSAYALCQSPKFVGRRKTPCGFVFVASHELSVVEELARVYVHDRHSLIYFVLYSRDPSCYSSTYLFCRRCMPYASAWCWYA